MMRSIFRRHTAPDAVDPVADLLTEPELPPWEPAVLQVPETGVWQSRAQRPDPRGDIWTAWRSIRGTFARREDAVTAATALADRLNDGAGKWVRV